MHKFKLTKQSSMALIIVFSMVLSLLSPTMTLFKASENDRRDKKSHNHSEEARII